MTHTDCMSPARTGPRSSPVRVFRAVVRALAAWFEERRAIAQLRELDDAMLRDMGITRGDIRAAVRGEIYRR